MPRDSDQVLSYATAASRPRRFGHMKALFPFCSGLVVGAVMSGALVAAAPVFIVYNPTEELVITFFIVLATVLPAVYATVVLLLIGCFSKSPREQKSFTSALVLGMGIPVLAAAMLLTGTSLAVVVSVSALLQDCLGWTAFAVMILLMLAAPFLLVRWRAHRPTQLNRQGIWPALIKIAGGGTLLAVMFGLGRWAVEKKFDRDCQEVAAWVKSNHPTLGKYLKLPLPASQYALSADHMVAAVEFPDGRIILVLKTFAGGHATSYWFVYASAPIKPSEIGTDAYGRPEIQIDGLPPAHFVEKQLDWQHFVVAFDLG